MKIIIASGVALGLMGCANQFETRRFDRETWKANEPAVEGVIYYEPQLVKVTYHFTVLQDSDGKVLAEANAAAPSSKCEKMVQKEEIQIVPNFAKPLVLINKPGPFSSGTFAVNLSNGMLTSVNSESKPIGTDVLTALGALASGVGALKAAPTDAKLGAKDTIKPTALRACNSAPVLTAEPLNLLDAK